ncbi:MAG: hypothetical protein V4437_00905 [Patescibacteria group bacterium]
MTYDKAIVLAKKLRTLSPRILGIELFGSVLKNGYGRDADFVVLVDDELAKRWWTLERESIRVRWPDFLYGQRWMVKIFFPFIYTMTVRRRRQKRLVVSAELLGFDLGVLADAHGTIPDFEMFLLPGNWREGTEVNIEHMTRVTDLTHDVNTLGFLKRIAKDASPVE